MKYSEHIHTTYTQLDIISDDLSAGDVQELQQVISEQIVLGTSAFVLNVAKVIHIHNDGIQALIDLHNHLYSVGNSLVIAAPAEILHNKLKMEQAHLMLNICPTLVEAVDIVSMEMLERDLMKEEE